MRSFSMECRQISPCFPRQVVRSMPHRDVRLYALFHVLLWFGTAAFFCCLAAYTINRNYIFFILPLPCILVMFAGLFGFRWLALRNADKFRLYYQQRCTSCSSESVSGPGCDAEVMAVSAAAAEATDLCRQPPPVYSIDYDGPIFTIYGLMVPPPTYSEVIASATTCDLQQQQQQHQQQQQQTTTTAST